MKKFIVKLSIEKKPFEKYEINISNNESCHLCETRLCYKKLEEIVTEYHYDDGIYGDIGFCTIKETLKKTGFLPIDSKYWNNLVSGTIYYRFTKKSIKDGMILDMSNNPDKPGFCSGDVTGDKNKAQKELRKITQKSFCPAIANAESIKISR